tara:strand:+ start:11252 stop:11833 length:582 start_codon:yes stop_codon:yes gene_type:complete
MKTELRILLIAILLVSCKEEKAKNEDHNHSKNTSEQVEQTKKESLSPHTSAMAMVGDAHIHFDYSSPGVRNRIVFGGLLPYDAVWQAGAHMATWMETNKDLTIDGNELKAGKYGFFIVPNKEEWTLIFNSNWDQHGKDEYDEKDDVLRFKVTPTISEALKEHLEYKVTKATDTSGIISLSWEKVIVEFPFKVE